MQPAASFPSAIAAVLHRNEEQGLGCVLGCVQMIGSCLCSLSMTACLAVLVTVLRECRAAQAIMLGAIKVSLACQVKALYYAVSSDMVTAITA